VVRRVTDPAAYCRLDIAYRRIGLVATESHDRCCCYHIRSRFNEVTVYCSLLPQSTGLTHGVEYQLVILDSVVDGMYYGNGDDSAALDATVDD
jgi:hypothetical protein